MLIWTSNVTLITKYLILKWGWLYYSTWNGLSRKYCARMLEFQVQDNMLTWAYLYLNVMLHWINISGRFPLGLSSREGSRRKSWPVSSVEIPWALKYIIRTVTIKQLVVVSAYFPYDAKDALPPEASERAHWRLRKPWISPAGAWRRAQPAVLQMSSYASCTQF